MKKIVLNACGVKSLGGLKLFLESFDFFSKTDSKIIVLYSEIEFYKDLNNQFYENPRVKFYKTTNKRYLHPFLNYFLPTKILEEINKIDEKFSSPRKTEILDLGGGLDDIDLIANDLSLIHISEPTRR